MIVFPMAGTSSRFKAAGYCNPKYMLPLGSGSMFSQVLKSFRTQFTKQPFLFICRNIAQSEIFIRTEIENLHEAPIDWRIVVLKEETSGQAETVYKGLIATSTPLNTPITIFNIDSHYKEFTYPSGVDLEAIDGYLEVVNVEGDHWSFVLPDVSSSKPGSVAKVTEKKRISNLCSSGLYYFREAEVFNKLYENTVSKDPSELDGGERYVAPLYNQAIAQKLDIRFAEIPAKDIVFTGTPDEYHSAVRALGPKLAVCLTGQLRGPKEHQALISKCASELGADVFVSTWSIRGRKNFDGSTNYGQLKRLLGLRAALLIPQNLFNNIDIAFPKTRSALEREESTVLKELSDVFQDAVIDVEESDQLSLDIVTSTNDVNSLRMLYKIWRCNQLKRKKEINQSMRYDYVIRFRLDCLPDIKAFLESRTINGKLQVPPGVKESSVSDIFWMGSSAQDDYMSSLFGRAIQFHQDPWTNIHRELKVHLERASFDFEAAEKTRTGIVLDNSPEERKNVVENMARELLDPCVKLKNIIPEDNARRHLAELLLMPVTEDNINTLIEKVTYEDGAAYFVLRGVVILAMGIAQQPDSDTQARASLLVANLLKLESGIDGLDHRSHVMLRNLDNFSLPLDVASTTVQNSSSCWLSSICNIVEEKLKIDLMLAVGSSH